MKLQLRALIAAAGLLCAATGFAQTAAPAVKDVAATSTTTTPAVKTPAAPASKAVAASVKASAPAAAVAAGGGNGKVWVNTKSKAYHCEGSKFYGTTKVGEYMTEADAKAKGNHGAEKGKACAK